MPVDVPLGGNGNGNQPMHKLVEQFLKLKPPKFTGAGDPEAATLWIRELDKVFALLRCTDEDKVTLAVYQLQGNASTWWEATQRRVFPEGTARVWGAFVEAFYNKYFLDCAREQKMNEFRRLRREPIVGRPMLRQGFLNVPICPEDYNELYERAQLIERNLAERTAASGSRFVPNKDNHRFGKRPMTGSKFHVPPNKKGGVRKPVYNNNGPCRFCGRHHGSAPCPMRTGVCFGCGQHGHHVRDCPRQAAGAQRPMQQVGQPASSAPPNQWNRPQVQGRVYAVTRKEAEDSPAVITGTVSLHDHAAYALFDPGATHSFVAKQFVELVGLSPKPLGVVYNISTPLKDSIVSAVGCTGCRLSVGGREDSIDLIVLTMFDFDVIIGMDWLTKQRATVNCYRKTIQFEPVGSVGFEFVGNRGGPSIPLISSLEATQLLDEGCQGYLATVIDTLVEEPGMQDIAVVREFSDVFPEELPGVFKEYLDKFVIVFIDDILVYSKSSEEHQQHLRTVLQTLRDHKLGI
ncbi:uncharacterized protein LOC130138216 [Syzygium oleosum]|uniref:uncharacterized protein LOC130138216 n=1 Tax=Syzygium oleosum TaxID=219896 RepID=UPI0024B97429|nr:uncharacterized protein LOC130138216 [Syzygium oleosum]